MVFYDGLPGERCTVLSWLKYGLRRKPVCFVFFSFFTNLPVHFLVRMADGPHTNRASVSRYIVRLGRKQSRSVRMETLDLSVVVVVFFLPLLSFKIIFHSCMIICI